MKLEYIYTKNDVNSITEKLEVLRNSFYKTNGQISKITNKSLTLEEKEMLMEFSKSNRLNFDNVKDFSNIIEGFIKYIANIPVLTLTVAFNPTYENTQNIAAEIKERVGREVIISFKTNPAIIGGAVLEYNGKYKSHTLIDKVRGSQNQHSL